MGEVIIGRVPWVVVGFSSSEGTSFENKVDCVIVLEDASRWPLCYETIQYLPYLHLSLYLCMFKCVCVLKTEKSNKNITFTITNYIHSEQFWTFHIPHCDFLPSISASRIRASNTYDLDRSPREYPSSWTPPSRNSFLRLASLSLTFRIASLYLKIRWLGGLPERYQKQTGIEENISIHIFVAGGYKVESYACGGSV